MAREVKNPRQTTWQESVTRAAVIAAELRLQARSEQEIALTLYDSCQNISKKNFQDFLDDVGVKSSIA